MFVDEITITARAGKGGDGVVRWRREKFVQKGGPAGGNGGKGGDVYMRAVRDLGLLYKYTGAKEFAAENGTSGSKRSRHGRGGKDLYIDVPVGAVVTEQQSQKQYFFTKNGQIDLVLRGGAGGFGNEYFKSSKNTTPQESTAGKPGERGTFVIDLELIADAGIIGVPNAGKSTLLNALTNTKSKVGSYPFTTVEPHLGDLFGFILADIPGLIEGAAEGKGLGHKFLKHIRKTSMLLHCVPVDSEDLVKVYTSVRHELEEYDEALLGKVEWVVLTKTDLVSEQKAKKAATDLLSVGVAKLFQVSAETGEGIKELREELAAYLKTTKVPLETK